MFSSFMVNAWIVGTIVAVVAGAVGFFVVTRGSAFAAHAVVVFFENANERFQIRNFFFELDELHFFFVQDAHVSALEFIY